MKVTIEFDTETDRELLDSVLNARTMRSPLPDADAVPIPPPTAVFAPHDADAVPIPPPPPVPGPFDAPATQRDADGLPWDGRIHSSSKALLADGRWRQRRNTDPALVASVTAELKAALSAPAAVPIPPVAAVPTPPAAVLTPPAAVPTPPAGDGTGMSFLDFMRAITAARTAPQTVLEACQSVGIPNIPALAQRPDLIPSVATALGVA